MFGQKAHKTQQITLTTQQFTQFNPKRRFILNPNIPRTDLQLKMYPYRLPNETLGFSWDGLMYSTHITAKFPDWFNSRNRVFSLVKTMSSISRTLQHFSQQDLTMRNLNTYIHVTHLTICGTTLKHTLFEMVYEEEKEPQNKSMPIFRNCMATQ